MGETYDARRELGAWSKAGFNDQDWAAAVAAKENPTREATYYGLHGASKVSVGFVEPELVSNPAPPVRVIQELRAEKITGPQPGIYIFDFGENFAGMVRLKVSGTAGQKITLRHGQMLHSDGSLMTENLGAARATDTYVCKGDSNGETWSPRFTYHGFRYVEVTGLTGKPPLELLTGLVTHIDTPVTAGFECSDPLLNRLFQNCLRTLRANSITVPTAVAQGDRRMGDVETVSGIARSYAYLTDETGLYHPWFRSMDLAAGTQGFYPILTPNPLGYATGAGGTPYSDGAIASAFETWWMNGDNRTVYDRWEKLRAHVQARIITSGGLKGTLLGPPDPDRGNLSDPTGQRYIDQCFLALDLQLMSLLARASQQPIEHLTYFDIFGKLLSAFQKEYVTEDSALKERSQTAEVLALRFRMLDEKAKQKGTEALVHSLNEARNQDESGLRTGVLGTNHILRVLSLRGHHDRAVQLVQSRKFPSWGYSIQNGATTLWSRPDAYSRKHGFKGVSGTLDLAEASFADPTSAAVSAWLMSILAGIDADQPGFSQIKLEPWIPTAKPVEDGVEPIRYVRAHYDSCRGRIAVHWRLKEDGSLLYECTIPTQTTARLLLPVTEESVILESGKPLADKKFDGGVLREIANNKASLVLTSGGSYRFEIK